MMSRLRVVMLKRGVDVSLMNKTYWPDLQSVGQSVSSWDTVQLKKFELVSG